MQNTKETKARFMSWPQLTAVIIAAFIGLYVFLASIPFIGPYFQYPLYVVKCGGQPVIAYKFMSAQSYMLPGTSVYRVDGMSTFYCSEKEAIDNGYRKYP
ncbi:MAG TPA: hypothetical protein VFZ58_01620 [Candidatus Saccharimonadales bacterium]